MEQDMNHNDFKEQIAAYIDGELDEALAKNLKQHIDSCPECNRVYSRTLKTKSVLNKMPVEELSSEFSTRLEGALQDRYKRQEPQSNKDRKVQILAHIGEIVFTKNRLKFAATAAAALLLCVIGLNRFYIQPRGFRPIVIAAKGSVQIYNQDKNEWSDLAIGAVIDEYDRITLGKDAQVDIAAKNIFNLRLKEKSEARFMRLARSYKQKFNIEVDAGKALFSTGSRFKDLLMEVDSPTSRTMVVGTKFIVDVNPAFRGATWVSVLNGKVSVKARNIPNLKDPRPSVIVKEGQKVYIGPGDFPNKPRPLSASEFQQQAEIYKISGRPEIVLLISGNRDRVNELMSLPMLYVYDVKPRKLPVEFEDILLTMKEAMKTRNLDLHEKAANKLEGLIKSISDRKYAPQLYLFLGAYRYFLGSYNKSVASFDRMLRLYPDSKWASLALCAKAFAYENGTKDKDKAKDLYSLVLSRHPHAPEAAYAAKALKRL